MLGTVLSVADDLGLGRALAYLEQCVIEKRLAWLDEELADRPFIAGERFTIADITALCGIDFGKLSAIRVDPGQKNLTRWHEAVSSRPSAKA